MRGRFDSGLILIKLQEDILREFLRDFPVPQETQGQAENHNLVVIYDAGKINGHNG